MKVFNLIYKCLYWVERDFRSHPLRFIIETTAWSLSIIGSFIVALTTPRPPLHIIYPLWVISSSMFIWSAKSRGSFGMLINYILLVLIDAAGLLKTYLI